VASTKAPPILLRFTNKIDKADFHKMYFAKKDLKLDNIGFAGDNTRIYISENLTKYNKEIFDAALNLKKDGKLVSVSTFHGTVSVKLAPTDRPKQILCLADLDSLFTSDDKD
jgi:hypothetical protein